MAATTSEQFLLNGLSFVVKTEGNTATVVRTSTGKALTQSEKDTAGDNYNSDTNEINYATIYDLNFGPDYIDQLGASDEWMSTALSSNLYKDTFKKATGKNSINITEESEQEGNKNWEVTQLNRNANGKSTSIGTATFIGRYPLNESYRVKYDYLQVTSYKHKSNTFDTDIGSGFADADERIGSSVGKVFLPMQPGLSESNNVDWGGGTLNAMEAAAFRVAQRGIAGVKDGFQEAAKTAMETGIGEIEKLGGAIDINDIATFFAGQAIGNQTVFTRGTGKVLNPNLELLFNGPMLRSFNYNFRFTPREDREARMIKDIIKFFKKSMAPKRDRARVFLSTPNVFKLKYIFKNGDQHPFLNKIKLCALQNFTVDYTPDGSYMTYDDGSMTAYNVSMSFGELNPLYESDFDNDTNDMGF